MVVDGEKSDPGKVTSGVPQGSVLGPVLFLIFMNDIVSDIDSSIRLFADDCLLYRTVENDDDRQAFQQDLTKLTEWANVIQREQVLYHASNITTAQTNSDQLCHEWESPQSGQH